MNLGAFCLSLAVKDIAASRAFYEKLGFEVTGGNQDHNWLVLRNGGHTIGLFQGMFERNMLTFNPGWNQQAEEVNPFTDVREIQREIARRRGVLFFDWSALTERECGADRWFRQGLIGKDRVHFQKAGYWRTADALYARLLAGYRRPVR